MNDVEWPEGTEALLDQIITDAYGDDEQLWALRDAFEDSVPLPADAFVIGEPVEVVGVDYDSHPKCGLRARCCREDGTQYVVSASEVCFPEDSVGARHVAAYRRWMGLNPAASSTAAPRRRPKRHKAADRDLDISAPVELVVLAPKERAARCRVPGTQREITLRSGDVWDMVAGETVTVLAHKQWHYAGHPYLSGDVKSHRLDVKALGLVPLRLLKEWEWDPAGEYWGEEGEPIEEWAAPIIARGKRPSFQMEQVLPGADPGDCDSDPILDAADLYADGDWVAAGKLLAEILAADLRCLDAHAHLGNFALDDRPELAIRHYEVGVRIGELSLGDTFDGVLPWGRVDNRPFLRCMHGFGLCLWRLGRVAEAAALLERMLWLNPTDNQGIRFLLPQVHTGQRWEHHHDG